MTFRCHTSRMFAGEHSDVACSGQTLRPKEATGERSKLAHK